MTSTDVELVELDRKECLELLRSAPVGRFAVAPGGVAPLVVPVNFLLDGETVVFRSEPGEKIDGFENRPASLEIDGVDVDERLGWSVLVRGMASVVPCWAGPADVELHPWGGDKPLWVRLVPAEITGRRLVHRHPVEAAATNDG